MHAGTPVDVRHVFVASLPQAQCTLHCSPLPAPPKADWISLASWQLMVLLATWRPLRSVERDLWINIQKRLLFQARRSHGYGEDRAGLSREIAALRLAWARRLAKCHSFAADTLRHKCAALRTDKRAVNKATVGDAAEAADQGDTKAVFSCLRNLEPWQARPFPVIKNMDGTFARGLGDRGTASSPNTVLIIVHGTISCSACICVIIAHSPLTPKDLQLPKV